MKKRKSSFQRVFSALKDVMKVLEKEKKKTYKLGKEAHQKRFEAEYLYGFAVGRNRQANDTLALARKIVLKM